MKFTPSILIILIFIYSTTNAQWTIKHLNENSYNAGTVGFTNDSLGLFMGSGSTILKTTDIGETWNPIQLDFNIDISGFQFIGDSSIFAVGSSKLIKSENLGEIWDSISSLTGKQLYSLWFFNNDSGIVAGYDGIYRTVDKCSSWDTVWSVTQFGYKYGSIRQLTFSSSDVGYAIGNGRNQSNDPLFDNFLLKSNDSGITWDTIKTFSNSSLSSMYFINQDSGFIGTGSGVIYGTVDGGINWSNVRLTNYENPVKSIQFTSEMNGFATGGATLYLTSGGSSSFFISKTIDGGKTWASYDTIGVALNSIYFINSTVGFVSGDYELIMKSNEQMDKLPENYPWHLIESMDIDENTLSNSDIKIYPNPTNGILYIQSKSLNNKIDKVSLINSAGKIINIGHSVSNNGIVQIDLSDLLSGLYLIKFEYADKIETMKIIKI